MKILDAAKQHEPPASASQVCIAIGDIVEFACRSGQVEAVRPFVEVFRKVRPANNQAFALIEILMEMSMAVALGATEEANDYAGAFVKLAEETQLPDDHPIQLRAEHWLVRIWAGGATPDIRMKLCTSYMLKTLRSSGSAIDCFTSISMLMGADSPSNYMNAEPDAWVKKILVYAHLMHDVLFFESHCELSYPLFRRRVTSYYMYLAMLCFASEAPEATAEVTEQLLLLLSFYDDPQLRETLSAAGGEDVIVSVGGEAKPKINISLFDVPSLASGVTQPLFSTSLIRSGEGDEDTDHAVHEVHIAASHFRGDVPHLVLTEEDVVLVVSRAYLRRLRPSEADMQKRREAMRRAAEEAAAAAAPKKNGGQEENTDGKQQQQQQQQEQPRELEEGAQKEGEQSVVPLFIGTALVALGVAAAAVWFFGGGRNKGRE